MRRRSALYGWLAAEVVSLSGTRLSMVALPWFVLTTSGSATQTGLVAFAELAPYVLAKATAGPWVDRLGPRRVCVAADLLSAVVVGAVPVLHQAGLLPFPLLLALVALAGLVRGPGDGARHALIPAVVATSGVPLERATGLAGTVDRLAGTVGTAAAGVVVTTLGATTALAIDAASFVVSALLLAALAPRPARSVSRSDRRGYLRELGEGWAFLRRDPVLVAMTSMVAVTNLLDAAYVAVLVPVWARESGGGAAAVGTLLAVFSAGAVGGSVLAATYAARLPRLPTYTLAFLVGGAPRFLVLALDVPLGGVVAFTAVSGLLCGLVNPILGAVVLERIPERLVGRVSALNASLCWVGMPVGGLAAGLLVSGAGFHLTLALAGTLYLGATLLPLRVPAWRTLAVPVEPVAPVALTPDRGTTG